MASARKLRAVPDAAKRAVGYIRVSQIGGRTGDSFLSPEIQREKIEAWAAYREFTVTKWYVDLDVSGNGKVPRPEFDQLLADAREHRFEAVAVYRLTRFGRSVADAAAHYKELRALGIDLVSCTEDIDTTTASGEFLQNILFAAAQFESQRIGEAWREVHANRRARGIAQVNRMFGYETRGTVIIGVNEPEAEALREMFAMRARGATTAALQNFLRERGFRSKRKGNVFIAGNTIRDMLRNPVYLGLVRAPDGTLSEGQHPALIGRDVFDVVQATFKAPTPGIRTGGRGGSLSGLLVCSGCGHPLTSEGRRYRCKHRESGRVCACPVAINSADAEEIVEGAFLRRFDPKRMRVRVSRRPRPAWERDAARHRKRAQELTAALDRIAEARFIAGTMEAEEYARVQREYLAERQEHLEAAERLEAQGLVTQQFDTSMLAAWSLLTPAERGRALRTAIESVIVRPARGRGRYATPLVDRLEIGWIA